jgi:DivIVA domain-containing protein
MEGRRMDFSSMDIERKTFDTTRKGGFDREQVVGYLRELAKVMGRLHSESTTGVRRINDLERELTQARLKADEASKSFLFAAEMKQRLLAEAETRALEILQGAHADMGADDPAGTAAADLGVVRRRSGVESDEAADAAGSLGVDQADDRVDDGAILESARAEAAEIVASARGEAGEVTAAADEYVAKVHAEADRILEEAQLLLANAGEGSTDPEAANADGLVAEARIAAERLVHAAEEENAQAFAAHEARLEQARNAAEQARNEARAEVEERLAAAVEVERQASGLLAEAGEQATSLLEEAGERAARLKEEAEAALDAAKRAEDEAVRLNQEADAERVAAALSAEEAAKLRDGLEADRAQAAEDRDAARVARERAEQLAGAAEDREREADRAVARSEARLDASVAESRKMTGDAASEAAELRNAGREKAKELETAAIADAEKRLRAAKAEAAGIISRAENEAAAIFTESRARHEAATAKLRDLDRLVEQVHQRAAGPDAEDDTEIVILLQEARESAAGVKAQIRLPDGPEDDDKATSGDEKMSRYERRSAGLPHLGDEASGSVLSDMGSLRRTESEGKHRRRRPK